MAFVYTYGLTDTAYVDGESTSDWQPQNFAYGGVVTFAEAGTIDQLGLYGRTTSGTPAIKFALYDTSGNLVAQGTGTITSGTAGWVDSGTFTAVAVAATTYVILYSSSAAQARYGYDTANDGSFCTEAHASFPADPETISINGDADLGYGGRANFVASAGGTILPFMMHYH